MRFVRDIGRIPEILEGGIRCDLRLVNALIYQVHTEKQCWLVRGLGNIDGNFKVNV